jgi:hypothetical protein
VAALYTDTPTLKSYLSKDSRTVDDAWLGILLDCAESTVRRMTGHNFGLIETGVSKVYSTLGKNRVRVVDAQNVTQVILAGSNILPNYWMLDTGMMGEPAQWIYIFAPISVTYSALGFFANGLNDLTVKGDFGWSPPPADITDATYVLAARYHKERGHEYSDAVQTEAGLMTYYKQLPGRVQAALSAVKVPNIVLV